MPQIMPHTIVHALHIPKQVIMKDKQSHKPISLAKNSFISSHLLVIV